MTARIAAVAMLVSLCGRGAIAQACAPATEPVSEFDRLHPERFVSVHEVTSDNQFRPIHVAMVDGSAAQHPPAYTRVDVDSKIHISFDRKWIAQQPDYQTNIQITADLNGEPIAVPGYSEVGTQATSGTVNARGFATATAAMCSYVNGNLGGTVTAVQNSIRIAQGNTRSPVSDSVRILTAAIEEGVANFASLSDSARRDIANKQGALERLRANLAYQRVVQQYARTSADLLATSLDVAYPSLLAFSQLDSAITEVVAYRGGVPRTQLAYLVQNVISDKKTLDSLNAVAKTDSAWLRKADVTINRLLSVLPEIGQIEERYLRYLDRNSLQRDPILLDELRDTDILISRTKAKVDDRILLTFTNTVPPGSLNPRQMTLDLRVRRFGWVSDITDSFLFLRRLSASYQKTPNRVVAAEAAIRTGTAAHDTTIIVPMGVNFSLTPGATFMWTHYARNRSSALAPSVGLNVSFPKFETRTYQLTVAAGENRNVTRKESTDSNTFDLAVGGYVGLFDGAIGLTGGRAITAERRPWYFGVGLSFLRLAKNAAKFFPTGQ